MTQQQLILAAHLWWRYTWRAFIWMLPIGIIVGFVGAFERARHGMTVGMGIIMVLAIVASSIFILGWVFRSKAWLKPAPIGGHMLHPFITVRGVPKAPMPWKSAYGILWGIHWRSWCTALPTLMFTRFFLTPTTHPIAYLLASLLIGQASVILSLAWLVAKPFGNTHIKIAEEPSSTMA